MTTAVVVTSIVTTNLGEAKFVDHILEQIRHNDRDLLNKLAKVDGDARVVTAILNVNEFMSYANEWLRQQQAEKKSTKKRRTAKPTDPALFKVPDAAKTETAKPGETKALEASVQLNGIDKTTVVNQAMSEGEFMEYTLAQLRQGKVQAFSSFTAEEAEQMEDEPIGEDFSRQPFLY